MIPLVVYLSPPSLRCAPLYALTSAVLPAYRSLHPAGRRRKAPIRGVMLLLFIVAALGAATLLVVLFAPQIR